MRNQGTIDSLKETASSVVDTVTDAKRDALSHGEDIVSNMTRIVKKHPIKSIAIAFGIGYLGSKVLRR